MNIRLRTEVKNDLEKYFFLKLINNAVFGKTMEKVRKHRAYNNKQKKKIFIVRTKLSYYKMVFRKFIRNRNKKKNKCKMNKPVYLGLSILEISKILMYEFWYDYIQPKY